MKIRLKRRPHSNIEQLTKYDVTKLDDPKCISIFRHKIRQDFNNCDFNSIITVDERWNKAKNIINKTADAVIGKQKKK